MPPPPPRRSAYGRLLTVLCVTGHAGFPTTLHRVSFKCKWKFENSKIEGKIFKTKEDRIFGLLLYI